MIFIWVLKNFLNLSTRIVSLEFYLRFQKSQSKTPLKRILKNQWNTDDQEPFQNESPRNF